MEFFKSLLFGGRKRGSSAGNSRKTPRNKPPANVRFAARSMVFDKEGNVDVPTMFHDRASQLTRKAAVIKRGEGVPSVRHLLLERNRVTTETDVSKPLSVDPDAVAVRFAREMASLYRGFHPLFDQRSVDTAALVLEDSIYFIAVRRKWPREVTREALGAFLDQLQDKEAEMLEEEGAVEEEEEEEERIEIVPLRPGKIVAVKGPPLPPGHAEPGAEEPRASVQAAEEISVVKSEVEKSEKDETAQSEEKVVEDREKEATADGEIEASKEVKAKDADEEAEPGRGKKDDHDDDHGRGETTTQDQSEDHARAKAHDQEGEHEDGDHHDAKSKTPPHQVAESKAFEHQGGSEVVNQDQPVKNNEASEGVRNKDEHDAGSAKGKSSGADQSQGEGDVSRNKEEGEEEDAKLPIVTPPEVLPAPVVIPPNLEADVDLFACEFKTLFFQQLTAERGATGALEDRTVVGEKDTGHAISALGNLLKNPIDRVIFYQCAWDLS